MGKLEVLGSLVKLYLSNKSEWFYNYKLSMYIFLLSVVTFVLYVLFGEFSGFVYFWRALQLFIFIHIVLSVYVVLGDYLFNIEVKTWCQGIWLLLSFRIMMEVFVF